VRAAVLPVLVIARHALGEAARRRVLHVVVVLTALFGALYLWGAGELFDNIDSGAGHSFGGLLSPRELAGGTMLGLAMFGALFLATVLATLLCAGAVRGDAETGLLQPLLVRPLARSQYLAGRWLAAAITAALYALLTYLGAVLVIGFVGHFWPAQPLAVGLRLALAVAVLTALALLGATRLNAMANGIVVLMLYGAGLVAGLMGTIGEGIGSQRLTQIADTTSWVLPFEGLYRDALQRLVSDVGGPGAVLLQLGPLGSSHDQGPWMVPWAVLFIALVLAAATWLLKRRDL